MLARPLACLAQPLACLAQPLACLARSLAPVAELLLPLTREIYCLQKQPGSFHLPFCGTDREKLQMVFLKFPSLRVFYILFLSQAVCRSMHQWRRTTFIKSKTGSFIYVSEIKMPVINTGTCCSALSFAHRCSILS